MRGWSVLVLVAACGDEVRTSDDSLDDLIEYVDASIDAPRGSLGDAGGTAQLVIEPMSADFGLLPVGGGSGTTRLIQIINFGFGPAMLLNFRLDAPEFSILSTNCGAALPASELCNVQLAATPLRMGNAFGLFSLDAEVGDGMGQTVNVGLNVTGGRTVRLTVGGMGSGVVRSTLGKLSCPGVCDAFVSETVSLDAVAEPGSVFAGWSGDCAGSEPVCSITAEPHTAVVHAMFEPN
jgi:hypothetical protein